MTGRSMAAVPALGTVWGEQLRTVALGVRRELIIAALGIAVPTLIAAVMAQQFGERITLDPAEGYGWLAALLAVLFPLAVWKDETRFGDSHLWTLPVDRRRHALLKVAAGWAVLMTFLVGAALWLCAVVLLTGGHLGAEEARLLLMDRAAAEAGTGGTGLVQWTTPAWQWVVPVSAATIAYLIGSALMLATPRPWWWVGGAFLLIVTLGVISEEFDVANALFERVVFGPVFHPLGLDAVMTSGWDSLTTAFERPDGSWAPAWRSLPTLGGWLTATGLWGGIGAAGLWAALLRHRDG